MVCKWPDINKYPLFSKGLADKYDYLLKYYERMAGGETIGFNNSGRPSNNLNKKTYKRYPNPFLLRNRFGTFFSA